MRVEDRPHPFPVTVTSRSPEDDGDHEHAEHAPARWNGGLAHEEVRGDGDEGEQAPARSGLHEGVEQWHQAGTGSEPQGEPPLAEDEIAAQRQRRHGEDAEVVRVVVGEAVWTTSPT